MFARLVGMVYLACFPLLAPAEALVLDRAEFVMHDSPGPPPDSAPWQPINLPDNWNLSRRGVAGQGWYRIALPVLEDRVRLVRQVHMPRNAAMHIAVFINGSAVGGTASYPDPQFRRFQQPVTWNVPRSLLRDQDNVMHVRVRASGEFRQGLTRVVFGDGFAVQQVHRERVRTQVLIYVLASFAVFAAGLFALVIWMRRRDDAAFF